MSRSQIASVLLALLPAASLAQVGAWGQCGGNGHSGSTACVSGYHCNFVNEWYSQCIPGAASTSAAPAATSAAATSSKAACTAKPTAASSLPSTPSSGSVKCPVVLDGRVPVGTSLTSFDTSNNLFNPDYVKGANLSWSEILQLPADASKFDGSSYTAVEVTISDKSIFNNQQGFRRAGLQFAADSSNDTSDIGIKTIHFSVKQDSARALNLSHEYLAVWHEAADYSSNQFNFLAGKLIDGDNDKSTFTVTGRSNNVIYNTPIDFKEWQNFAITLNYNANTLQVYYSKGSAALTAVTEAVANDNSGAGQFQIGVLKKPTGTADVVNSGYQEAGINEGLIYGGLFVEDSASSCISV